MTNQQDTALLPVEPGHYQIGDRVQIIHPDWQGEPPQYIAGIDWHGKHGVTYTTAETWPPKWDGLRAEGLTDEWQECDLIRLHAQSGSAAEQAKPSASCEAGEEVERVAALQMLRDTFRSWLLDGSDKQPHFDGARPWSTGDLKHFVKQLDAAITALRANAPEGQGEVERLREALKPFADCCDQIGPDEDDEEWAKFRLLIKDYRRAKAALASGSGR